MGMATQNSFHAAHVIDRSINEFQHHSHHTYVLICSPCFNLDTLPVKLLITFVILSLLIFPILSHMFIIPYTTDTNTIRYFVIVNFFLF